MGNIGNIPCHIGIIPDGNRRWALKRGLPAWFGHIRGYEVAKAITNEAWKLGVKVLTFYGLSRENCLKRPESELRHIYGILVKAVKELLEDARVRNGYVRLLFVGDFSLLPSNVVSRLLEANKRTALNGPYTLVVGTCYGGRWEIIDLVKKVARGEITIGVEDVSEEDIRKLLVLGSLPEPDLIIRSGGEYRVSGFLLYHIAYSEFYFTNTLWPDFTIEEFHRAIEWYAGRNRRFGA